MKKERVLVVHNYYQIPGGEDVVVNNESEMLRKNGHEVFKYVRHNNELKGISKLKMTKLLVDTLFSCKTYFDIRKVIKEKKIDIIHVHNTLPLISPSVYYAAWSMKKPVIQTMHNFRMVCPKGTFTRNGKVCEACLSKGLKQSLKYRCYQGTLTSTLPLYIMLKIHRFIGTYQKVNGYIALTDFSKKKLSTLVKDSNKIFVKPNFVNGKFSPKIQEKKEDYFVFIGRLEEIKGTDFLVEAWREINRKKLYIIGDGPDREKIEDFIKRNKINNVKMLGFLDKEKAMQLISKSIAVIIPSQCYEGFPMTIVESFSNSVPVIAGNIGNLKTIIKDRDNGFLFKYDNQEDLIRVVNFVIDNPELTERIGQKGFEEFVDKYNEIENYKYLKNIYNKVQENSYGTV